MAETVQQIDPCPFCASKATELIEADVGASAVACRDCGGIGPTEQDEAAAVSMWNCHTTVAKYAAMTKGLTGRSEALQA
jgi:Lar family restriction alleviation protein